MRIMNAPSVEILQDGRKHISREAVQLDPTALVLVVLPSFRQHRLQPLATCPNDRSMNFERLTLNHDLKITGERVTNELQLTSHHNCFRSPANAGFISCCTTSEFSITLMLFTPCFFIAFCTRFLSPGNDIIWLTASSCKKQRVRSTATSLLVPPSTQPLPPIA